MKKENENLLVGFVKIKELKISELEKTITEPIDSTARLTQNIIDTMKIECKILKQIVASEGAFGT
jgi:hypothetical protein